VVLQLRVLLFPRTEFLGPWHGGWACLLGSQCSDTVPATHSVPRVIELVSARLSDVKLLGTVGVAVCMAYEGLQ
jgi:hypothetical protein